MLCHAREDALDQCVNFHMHAPNCGAFHAVIKFPSTPAKRLVVSSNFTRNVRGKKTLNVRRLEATVKSKVISRVRSENNVQTSALNLDLLHFAFTPVKFNVLSCYNLSKYNHKYSKGLLDGF